MSFIFEIEILSINLFFMKHWSIFQWALSYCKYEMKRFLNHCELFSRVSNTSIDIQQISVYVRLNKASCNSQSSLFLGSISFIINLSWANFLKCFEWFPCRLYFSWLSLIVSYTFVRLPWEKSSSMFSRLSSLHSQSQSMPGAWSLHTNVVDN